MQHYLEKFVQQEGEPICQHLLRHRLRSARGQRGGREKKKSDVSQLICLSSKGIPPRAAALPTIVL